MPLSVVGGAASGLRKASQLQQTNRIDNARRALTLTLNTSLNSELYMKVLRLNLSLYKAKIFAELLRLEFCYIIVLPPAKWESIERSCCPPVCPSVCPMLLAQKGTF